MRFGIFLLISLAVAARAEDRAGPGPEKSVPPLLLEALTKLAQDFDRWAYTETRTGTDARGNPRGETVVRFDPSKPYAEQYTPLKIRGAAPSERQLKDYRKRGERRGRELEREESGGKIMSPEFGRFRLNGENAPVDLARAVVESETAAAITYNVPLKRDEMTTLPVEKFELLARINKERHELENVALRLRDSFRLKLVVKVQSGAANVDFTVVDPKHAPVVSAVSGTGLASVLFVKFGGNFDIRRSDYQRVKPYGERFGVKIGPMKALDF